MAGVFTGMSAKAGKDAQRPSLIKTIDIKASGETASQYQTLGTLQNPKLTLTQGVVEAAGGQYTNTKLWLAEIEADCLVADTTARAAVNLSHTYGVDVRVTTKNGDVFVLLYSDGTDVTFQEIREGNDLNNMTKMHLKVKGTITQAVYETIYTQGT